jgi:hypothetical protein
MESPPRADDVGAPHGQHLRSMARSRPHDDARSLRQPLARALPVLAFAIGLIDAP